MQGAPEGQGHLGGWQVEGTEPADAYGLPDMKTEVLNVPLRLLKIRLWAPCSQS